MVTAMSRQPCASTSASISRASAPQPISKVPPGAWGRVVPSLSGVAIVGISVVSAPGQGCAAGDFRPSVCDGDVVTGRRSSAGVLEGSPDAPVIEPLACHQAQEIPGDAEAELAAAGDAPTEPEG